MVGCGHSLECRARVRVSEGMDNAPRAEPSEQYSTILVPSAGTAVPRELRRYHPCTFRRYDGTTLVPGGGTLVKLWSFLYCDHTWEDDRCTSCRYKGVTVVSARGALSTLLHSIHLFGSFNRRPGEASSNSVASSELTQHRIGAPLHLPILEASSWITPTT